jgi:hypothetical protein
MICEGSAYRGPKGPATSPAMNRGAILVVSPGKFRHSLLQMSKLEARDPAGTPCAFLEGPARGVPKVRTRRHIRARLLSFGSSRTG